MIKVTIEDIINASSVFQTLANEEFNIITANKISNIIGKLSESIGLFNEDRNKLINEYGYQDEEGNTKIKEDCVEKFNEKITSMLNQTVTINEDKIEVSELSDIKISPIQLNELKKFM